MKPEAMQALRELCAKRATDGNFELYKSSKIFDSTPTFRMNQKKEGEHPMEGRSMLSYFAHRVGENSRTKKRKTNHGRK